MQRLNHNDLDLDLNDERVLKEMSIFSESVTYRKRSLALKAILDN